MSEITTAATERLLRLQDIQKAADVSRVTVYRWTHERGLRTVRVGGCVRVKETEWQRWLTNPAGTQPEPIRVEGNGQDQNGKETPSTVASEGDIEFQEFCRIYPRKVGVAASHNKYDKARRVEGDALLPKIRAALAWQSTSPEWTRERGRYIPKAAKYLAERQWEALAPRNKYADGF